MGQIVVNLDVEIRLAKPKPYASLHSKPSAAN